MHNLKEKLFTFFFILFQIQTMIVKRRKDMNTYILNVYVFISVC